MFDLYGYVLDKIEVPNDENIYLFCHLKRKTMKFKSQRSKSISTIRKRKIKHQIFEGKIVWIMIKQRRFYFSKNDKRLWEKLPNVSVKKQSTNIYRSNSIKSLRNSTYTHTADSRKSSPMFCSRLVDELPEINIYWPTKIKRIGLDGKNIGKHKQMFTLTNLDKNNLISAISPMNQKQLITQIKTIKFSHRKAVKEVCIDMDKFMKSVALKCFPKAKIVIDQFHVIQYCIWNLDKYRCRMQKMKKLNLMPAKYLLAKPYYKLNDCQKVKLSLCFLEHPDLKKGYEIIKNLRKIYSAKSYLEAKKQMDYVIDLCEKSQIPDMIEFRETLLRWYSEILNYHLSKTTNAFTEGIHNRFECIKRNHYGVRNYDRFVKRLMYTFIPASLFTELLSKVVG